MNRQRWMPGALTAVGLLAVGSVVAMPQMTKGPMAGNDRQFLTKAAEGSMLEVRLGELAQQQASHPSVKQFGQRMVRDHSKANAQLAQIARKKNAMVPNELDAKHQQMVDKLAGLNGMAFDRAYMAHMVQDHQEDVTLFQQQSRRGKDASLRSFARNTLPTLRTHLQMARGTARKVGASKTGMHHGM